MRPLPLETDRDADANARQTRPDPTEARPSSEDEEIWLEVQEF